jgi:hypothetical protein
MEVVENKVSFSFKKSDLLVQPLAFKSISYLDDLIMLLREDVGNAGQIHSSRLSFLWSYQVKDIAILLRDSLVNLLKLEQYNKDGLKTDAELLEYQEQLAIVLEDATTEVSQSYDNCLKSNLELNVEWQHQTNPVHAIIDQVNKLIDQIKTTQRSQHKLDKLDTKFADYRTSYLEHMEERRENVNKIQKILSGLKSSIEKEESEVQKPALVKIDSQILSSIEDIESSIVFAPYQFIILEDTDKLKLAVDTNAGQIVYKTIDVLSEISGWTSFNLTSPLKNIDTTLQTYKGRVLVGLIQISNRIKARFESGSDSEISISKSTLTAPLSRMITEYSEEILPNDLEKLKDLEEELKDSIRVSTLFNNQYNFLPSSAIGQLTGFAEKSELQRRYNPNRIRNLISTYTENLFTNYSKSEQITPAGYINNIISFDSESDVNALFLKHGFLGSSFSIDRPELMFRIDNHFQLWERGFGGALLITGKHLTGRSTILEMLPINYPDTTSYHIVPGQKIDINGHKTLMTHDLMATLQFIVKYKGSEKCMITIDDLAYYALNPEQTFALFSKLNSFIIKHSKQLYIAVVIHEFLYKKLRHFYNLKNIFTEVINTDNTATEHIESAVLTRAHAVANNEEANSDTDTLSSLSRKIAKKSYENIGRAMLLWCIYRNPNYKDNLSSSQFKGLVREHAPLLKTIIMHGTTSHPDLNRMLNDVDARQLKYDINGLIQIKLLYRPREGCIDINPYLKTFVEQYLV